MKMQSDLGRVRGLGSAKSGSSHWWTQRVTAVANLPLGIWFIISILSGHTADYDAVREWLSSYFHSTMMILMIISVSVHFTHGLQVVIEDYIGKTGTRIFLLLLNTFFAVALFAAAAFSILEIAT